MYCSNCGKRNPEDSKFCQYCGAKFTGRHISKETNKPAEHTSHPEYIDQKTSPYPYVISTGKLIILSITTFGLYEIYWFYKHFKSFKAEGDWKITPWARALFATIMSYSLFKHVSEKVNKLDKNEELNAGGLAILYFIFITLARLPDPYWWLSLLTIIPLIPVQNAVNYYWNKKYNDKLKESDFGP